MSRDFPVILLILLLSLPLCGQKGSSPVRNSEEDLYSWCAEFPLRDEETVHRKGKRLSRLVLGEKESVLLKPVASIVDPDGHLWVLGQGSGLLVRCDADADGERELPVNMKARYPSLVSLCLLPGSGILFTDSFLNGVYLYDPEKGQLRKFITSTSLDQPTGIAWSPLNDEVWVVETGAHRISVFDREGALLRSFGERGNDAGYFNYPTHIWIDASGLAYIVDAMNFRIQIFSPEGTFLSSFGKQGNTTGTLGRPKGIATDSEGNIYIADALFHTVQIFSREGDFLYYFGSQGSDREKFWMPAGIFIDQNDRIYVSDSYNNRVQIFCKKTKAIQ
ncbi:MAG: hypothetical protein ACOYXB_11090 [Bacteroidota bacterium]